MLIKLGKRYHVDPTRVVGVRTLPDSPASGPCVLLLLEGGHELYIPAEPGKLDETIDFVVEQLNQATGPNREVMALLNRNNEENKSLMEEQCERLIRDYARSTAAVR